MENTGVIFREQKEDYIAGTVPYEEICDDWTPYLPKGEKQHSVYFDSMACVSYSATSDIEIQLNCMLAHSLISEDAVKFFSDNGYLINGKFNFSDRFTAKMSGTTKDGNYLQKVWDSIKHDGLLPESDWAYPRLQRTPVFDWNDYYKEIPQELKDKAKKVLDYLDFVYEWVFQNKTIAYTNNELAEFKRELKQAPLQLAAPTCDWNGKQPIEPCGKTRASHATVIYKIDDLIYDYDSYDDFTKQLSLKYIMPWVMKGVVTLKTNNKDMQKLIGDNLNKKDLYAIGEDGKIRLIYNLITLGEGHKAGMWNKNQKIDWIDGIMVKYERGKDLIFLEHE